MGIRNWFRKKDDPGVLAGFGFSDTHQWAATSGSIVLTGTGTGSGSAPIVSPSPTSQGQGYVVGTGASWTTTGTTTFENPTIDLPTLPCPKCGVQVTASLFDTGAIHDCPSLMKWGMIVAPSLDTYLKEGMTSDRVRTWTGRKEVPFFGAASFNIGSATVSTGTITGNSFAISGNGTAYFGNSTYVNAAPTGQIANNSVTSAQIQWNTGPLPATPNPVDISVTWKG